MTRRRLKALRIRATRIRRGVRMRKAGPFEKAYVLSVLYAAGSMRADVVRGDYGATTIFMPACTASRRRVLRAKGNYDGS